MSDGDFPYGGTSGHSGTETSKARAVSNDRSGRTGRVQALALQLLARAGTRGLTVAEFRAEPQLDHHGSASGALSNLHLKNRIARLSEVRKGCKVYVLPEEVDGRVTEAHGRPKKKQVKEPVGPAACGCIHAMCNDGILYRIDAETPRVNRDDS